MPSLHYATMTQFGLSLGARVTDNMTHCTINHSSEVCQRLRTDTVITVQANEDNTQCKVHVYRTS